MKLSCSTPKQSFNKAYLKQRLTRNEIELFKTNLITLLDKIKEIEQQQRDDSEEHLKNNLRDFLLDTYYKSTNVINTKDKIDLVIHLGMSTNDDVGVIIEAKRPSNAGEMLSEYNPNRKAIHELILYYLNQRITYGNNQLKYLVATNINEWYIFDANYFDNHIYRNSQIKKLYDTKISEKKDNPFFYEEIAKILASSDLEIPCVYFDIRKYDKILRNTQTEDDKDLIALYKILSPQHLLKIPSANDSNSLNQNFYKELLHIIGLEEVKESGKNIIRRKKDNPNQASLIELAIDSLLTEDVFHRIPDISIYGEKKEERAFNIALELCLTWINRILFLKLLEGQLISYHNGNKDYRFLNSEKIQDFDELFNLFHRVLAIDFNYRKANNKIKYSKIPYLNSSLFEISDLEDQTIKINTLENNEELELINTTVLKDIKGTKNKLPILEYLFKFLDAFDFASEGVEEIQEDSKTLINASVLGKVFEKINGYKDGSIFTPGFITMYMCRQSIRMAVVQKFKDKYSWNIEQFDDIKNYLADRKSVKDILEFNTVINSLRICDPAVGSGHFLVSALNEIIAIKYELGLLADSSGSRIRDYEIIIENDELIITNNNGDIFEYKIKNGKPLNNDIQRLQKTLFHEKQTIIESCLFGVDINPNSVKICRLRLWIELLKNAYYKEEDLTQPLSKIGEGFKTDNSPLHKWRGVEGEVLQLETLPNIDINIKCGNSLLSRFVLDSDLSKALKSIKYNIESYRGFVTDYKNVKSREVKRGLQEIINSIKGDFRSEINKNDPRVERLYKLSGELSILENQSGMFDLNEKEKKELEKKKNNLKTEIKKISNEIEDIKSNAIYKNAFEWRFEFPEVLDNNGNFIGFDIVIGNPPYIDIKALNPDFVKYLFKYFKSTENRINLYSIFIELSLYILRNKGCFSFINPNSILMNSSYANIRNLIFNQVNEIIKLPDNVFAASDVKVETIILSFQKDVNYENINTIKYKHDENLELIDMKYIESQSKEFWKAFEDLKFNIYLTNEIQEVLKKIKHNTKQLIELADFTLGITPYDKYKGHTEIQIKEKVFHSINKIDEQYKPLISGENIQRYYINNTPKEFIKYGNWLGAQREERFFTQPRVIVRQIVSGKPPRIYAGYTDESLYFTQIGFSIIPKNNIHPKYLSVLINSSLINYVHKYLYLDIEKELFQKILIENCKKFPIKVISIESQQPFIDLVDIILAKKANNEDTSLEEREIDLMVYKLYDLTEEEIKIVEGY
jgi:hypothetical protein